MKTTAHTFLVGAHMSIAGGLEKSIERATSIGCTCMQIFTKSNQQWKAKEIDQASADLFKKTLKASTIRSVVVHASYLINLGSNDEALNKKSVHALTEELQRCQELDIPYLVLHPGSYGTSTATDCMKRIAHNLSTIIEKNPGKTMILLENTAGQGTAVGNTFEQLAFIRNHVSHPSKVGICFDTCHAFAAGYDFRTPTTYEALWNSFDKIIGLDHLKVLHMNDSKGDINSHLDRHADIGKGKLGIEAFRLICNDKRFFDIPKILETPKDNDLKKDIENMNTLHGLLTEKTRTILGVKVI